MLSITLYNAIFDTFNTYAVAGIALAIFSAVHFTKASNQEKENNGTGSSIISATAKVTNACASEIS